MEKKIPFSQSSDYVEETSSEAASSLLLLSQQGQLYASSPSEENDAKVAAVNFKKDTKSFEQSPDGRNKKNNRKLENKTHSSSKFSGKDNPLKMQIVETLQETKGPRGKDFKRNDNISEDSSDESGIQHHHSPSWKISENKSNTKLIFKLKRKTHLSPKSSEKDYFLKEHGKSFAETNKTKRSDFKSEAGIGEYSSGLSLIVDLSENQPEHLYHRKTNGDGYNRETSRKLERKRRSSSKSPRTHSQKENIEISTLIRKNKREANKMKTDCKETSSSDDESNVDKWSKKSTNRPARLSRIQTLADPESSSWSLLGETSIEKQTNQKNLGLFLSENGGNHSYYESKNNIPDSKVPEPEITIGLNLGECRGLSQITICGKEKHNKDANVEGSSKSVISNIQKQFDASKTAPSSPATQTIGSDPATNRWVKSILKWEDKHKKGRSEGSVRGQNSSESLHLKSKKDWLEWRAKAVQKSKLRKGNHKLHPKEEPVPKVVQKVCSVAVGDASNVRE